MSVEEVFVPFHHPQGAAPPVTHVRSTLIASSLRSIEARGRSADYAKVLDPKHRETIFSNIAAQWLAIEVGVAHYNACDALGFSPAEAFEIGTAVGAHVQGTFLGTMLRAAKTAGVTPWVALANTRKLYDRLFQGGDIAVIKLGPKEARVEIVGQAMCPISYWRAGFRGVYQVGISLFCTKAYVTEIPRMLTASSLAMRLAWA
jgi:hypothetical protein